MSVMVGQYVVAGFSPRERMDARARDYTLSASRFLQTSHSFTLERQSLERPVECGACD